jgi:hypothetical protein
MSEAAVKGALHGREGRHVEVEGAVEAGIGEVEPRWRGRHTAHRGEDLKRVLEDR